MVKNYETNEILRQLNKQGIKTKFNKSGKPIYLTAKEHVKIGIKNWGKIDFLKMNLIRK